MSEILFVLRHPDEDEPWMLRRVRLTADGILAWFQSHWEAAVQASDVDGWVAERFGGSVHTLAQLFAAARLAGTPAPHTLEALSDQIAALSDIVWVRHDEHSLRVLTDDDESEYTFGFFDAEVCAIRADRLALFTWRTSALPSTFRDRSTYRPNPPVHSLVMGSTDLGRCFGISFRIDNTGWLSQLGTGDHSVVAFDGVRLPDLPALLRSAESSEWPSVWQVCRAATGPGDRSVQPALETISRLPTLFLDEPLPQAHAAAHESLMAALDDEDTAPLPTVDRLSTAQRLLDSDAGPAIRRMANSESVEPEEIAYELVDDWLESPQPIEAILNTLDRHENVAELSVPDLQSLIDRVADPQLSGTPLGAPWSKLEGFAERVDSAARAMDVSNDEISKRVRQQWVLRLGGWFYEREDRDSLPDPLIARAIEARTRGYDYHTAEEHILAHPSATDLLRGRDTPPERVLDLVISTFWMNPTMAETLAGRAHRQQRLSALHAKVHERVAEMPALVAPENRPGHVDIGEHNACAVLRDRDHGVVVLFDDLWASANEDLAQSLLWWGHGPDPLVE